MRIIIMGTGPFALPTCRQILAAGHEVPLVVTRPVAQPGVKKQPARPVFEWAQQSGLEIFEPASINSAEAIGRLALLRADLFFVCDYGQILSNDCLSVARLGGINLHGSLLPRHRGAAPVQWALLRGDVQAGVTVIHMTPRLDAGPALAVAQVDILPDETAEELEPRLAELGVEATLSAIDQLSHWDGVANIGQLQDAALVTKAPRLSKADGQLHFNRPAIELERQVRGCQPWPGTYADLSWPSGKQMRLLIRAARAINAAHPSVPSRILDNALPGTVVPLAANQIEDVEALQGDWSAPWNQLMAVATGQGILVISRVQPAGKREMSVEEFLRGNPIAGQAHFTIP
jgi:methionyl-tRNA formyltransferase